MPWPLWPGQLFPLTAHAMYTLCVYIMHISDLRERKKTFPVLVALGSPSGGRLAATRETGDDPGAAAELIERAGGVRQPWRRPGVTSPPSRRRSPGCRWRRGPSADCGHCSASWCGARSEPTVLGESAAEFIGGVPSSVVGHLRIYRRLPAGRPGIWESAGRGENSPHPRRHARRHPWRHPRRPRGGRGEPLLSPRKTVSSRTLAPTS